MKVMKFGGSSVSSAERIRSVIEIVKAQVERSPRVAVVVSALGGVTDVLIHMGREAASGHTKYVELLEKLEERHFEAARALISETGFQSVQDKLKSEFQELRDILHGVHLVKELSNRTLDAIMSFGERLSAYIISQAMRQAIPQASYLDARTCIKTDNSFGCARVDYKKSYPLIAKKLESTDVPVITGFIGSSDKGETVTLGRGGSDFTAAIVGAAVNADEIEIWTDVDGVMTADPRKVKSAFPLPQMSYKEALEMSHFGAKVIHPPTIIPALQKNIPIWIKNTFNPKAVGTYISKDSACPSLICGISSIDKVALLRVEGSGMVGVPGISMRLFGALAKKEISIILISQASSEHSICFAVAPQQAALAKEAIEEDFSLEIQAGMVDPVIVEEELSILAAVGQRMRNTPGISGKLCGALGKNGINIVALAQGSSEYNISIVVKKMDETKALNVIHEEFFLSPSKTLNVYLVGAGLIGTTLLAQIKKQRSVLQKEHALQIQVIGIANSKKMVFDPQGIKEDNFDLALHHAGEQMQIASYIKKMKEFNLSNSIFVDCTASQEIADAYDAILDANIAIVTPNKKANSGNFATYQQLKKLAKARGIAFLYEANVGAGLPILSTLADLLKSGDKIMKVEAILSGTLSFLFNRFTEGLKFSQALDQAEKLGYTEPDPRDDLMGMDVKRKLLILARECGYPLEMDAIVQESILPSGFDLGKSIEEFRHNLKSVDNYFDTKRQELGNRVLRYIASLANGRAKISLEAVDAHHPFYHLSGSDNIIAITSERYCETPLIIKGKGAGAEVTAGEVFADIIRIAS